MHTSVSLFFITVLALLACGKVILQGRFSRENAKTLFDSVLYNAVVFLFIAVFLALFFRPGGFDRKTLLWGAGVGVLMMIFQVSYTYALKNGPVSLTVLICNFNVFIVSLFCILAFRERIYLSGILGMVFLIVSMFLSLAPNTLRTKGGVKWLVAVMLALLSSGGYTCLQKLFTRHSDSTTAFLITVYGSAFLCAGLWCLLARSRAPASGNVKAYLLYGLATAAVLAVYQKLFMYTLAGTDGSFFSPTYAGMQSVIMSVIGVLLFRDKLSKRQWLGVLFGILCVIVMNLNIVPL